MFAVGFGDPESDLPAPPGTCQFFERILAGLGATHLAADAGDLPNEGLDTTLASDVGSEAAWVAHHADQFQNHGGDLDDMLVLYAGEDDCDRIRAVLVRNGIACAADPSRHLARHALATLLQEILPWFGDAPPEEVTIEGETLRRLFQSPLVGSGKYEPEEASRL